MTLLTDSVYYPAFLSSEQADLVFKELNLDYLYLPREELVFRIFGKETPLPRDKCFYGEVSEDGDYPVYRYDRDLTKFPVVRSWEEIPLLKEVAEQIRDYTSYPVNHCVVNRYQNGSDHISYHQDKIRDFAEGAPVFTVSLGATRRFLLQSLQKNAGTGLDLEHGSLFELGWKTNQAYKHAIAKTAKAVGTRISLTFRVIQTLKSHL